LSNTGGLPGDNLNMLEYFNKYLNMQAVILAAGYGKRMGDLAKDIPKPLLKIKGKTLLEYKLDILPEEIREVVIVVGYKGEEIKKYLGDSYKNISIKYADSKKPRGTGEALHSARNLLRGRFLVLMGDDLYSAEDIKKCIENEYSILVYKVPNIGSGGKVILDENGKLKEIVEVKDHKEEGLINTACYVLDINFFNYPLVKIRGGEWGLPQTAIQMVSDFNISVVEASWWKQITSPQDLSGFDGLPDLL